MLEYFSKGGIMMWPLLLCSILSAAIIIERLFYYHRAKTDIAGFMTKLKKLMYADKIAEAVSLCEQTPGPVAFVLAAGLKDKEHGRIAMEESMEEAGLYAIPKLEKYLPTLSTLASISTLLGFTGTVTGMISAFNAIAAANVTTPQVVASGVSEALITTAYGLFIAIPTVVAYNYFVSRMDNFVLGLEKGSAELIGIITRKIK
ncbi:MAG: MotA/TolQ/ExbB proton channel family protein [Elusimicrobia bacterium]|nr:MotA/TolQ/ExbB proton channel family protein [Elusimicrobiota bacterium]